MDNCQNPNHHHCRCARTATLASGIVFALIAIAYLACYFMGNEVVVNGELVPAWKTWAGIIIAGLMSAWNFCSYCCKKCNRRCLSDADRPTIPPPTTLP